MRSTGSNDVVDKWAVIVGKMSASGDTQLHLHKTYEYSHKDAALEDIYNLKAFYDVVFIQQIKCDKRQK